MDRLLRQVGSLGALGGAGGVCLFFIDVINNQICYCYMIRVIEEKKQYRMYVLGTKIADFLISYSYHFSLKRNLFYIYV